MLNDKWIIKWNDFTESYAFGSMIEFFDKYVHFYNNLIPPGTLIYKWYSKTIFQTQRIEPGLPLVDGEAAYKITMNCDILDEKDSNLILRINYIDRYDNLISSDISREAVICFKPPITTISYEVELISGGVTEFNFYNLVIQEISKEELDEFQFRIEKDKEVSKKSKIRRRKDKKA